MRRVIKLTESDLMRIVKRVIKENEDEDKKTGGLTLRNVLSKSKQAASYIKNQMSDEEKEETLDLADSKGFSATDAKQVLSKVGSMDVEDLEDIKESVSKSYVINEGFGRKVASRLAVLIGAPVSLVSFIAGIAADAEGWSKYAWTTYLHDFMDKTFGDARGFVVILFFVLTFVNLIWGLVNWKGEK